MPDGTRESRRKIMCDFCQKDHTEEHTCARCGAVFCLDCGYLRTNDAGEADWLCFECDAELEQEALP